MKYDATMQTIAGIKFSADSAIATVDGLDAALTILAEKGYLYSDAYHAVMIAWSAAKDNCPDA